ncbi:hypothetical protein AA313_de0204833 [Arthrobotrys entomopaga]|nr:hypothetical protein AA313_de0204833 [Arthrobotrys entomopaga]
MLCVELRWWRSDQFVTPVSACYATAVPHSPKSNPGKCGAPKTSQNLCLVTKPSSIPPSNELHIISITTTTTLHSSQPTKHSENNATKTFLRRPHRHPRNPTALRTLSPIPILQLYHILRKFKHDTLPRSLWRRRCVPA